MLLVLALAAVPMALVLLQPDLGTTLVLVSVVLGRARGRRRRRAGGSSGCWCAGGLGRRRRRAPGRAQRLPGGPLRGVRQPPTDPRGVGYNTNQARIAIGSGGLTGTGLFEGTQTSGRFIPEQQTDFVFTVAGEELGLRRRRAVILLLARRALARAADRRPTPSDGFGRLVASGVVCWFAFQSFVNIGMTLGIMPVTGLPLPFVSYGGSAMFANLLAVGLLQNVARSRSSAP